MRTRSRRAAGIYSSRRGSSAGCARRRQLAMVLAHEMAHNRATHVVKGQDGQSLNKRVTAFGKRIFDDKLGVPWLSKGVKALADTSLNSYTRAQEEEADRIGFQYFRGRRLRPARGPAQLCRPDRGGCPEEEHLRCVRRLPGRHQAGRSDQRAWFARYGERDTSHLTRNTSSYMRLAQAYWQ
jgi:Zn-dependent protease with chaperone function